MKTCNMDDDFIFISYRNQGNEDLCLPVFLDCIALQEKGINCWIDTTNAGVDFNGAIKRALEHEKCIGSIVYLSEEYTAQVNGDICFEELKIINNRKKNDSNFFAMPVWLGNLNQDQMAKKLCEWEGNRQFDRVDAYKVLLGITQEIGRCYHSSQVAFGTFCSERKKMIGIYWKILIS